MRQRDIRPLPREFHSQDLSSLGILEGHVLAAINAVVSNLEVVAGEDSEPAPPPLATFVTGSILLHDHTRRLFGLGKPWYAGALGSNPAGLDLDFPERFERALQESPPVFPVLSVSVIMRKAEGPDKGSKLPFAQMPLAKDRVDDPVSGLRAVKLLLRGTRGQPLEVEVLR